MKEHYDKPEISPLFGLSDHNTVTVQPKIRDSNSNTAKVILKRDKRASRKAEMGIKILG